MAIINIPVFIIAFSISMLIVYLMAPEKKVVWLYPTRHKDIQYKNTMNKCFVPDYINDDCSIFATDINASKKIFW